MQNQNILFLGCGKMGSAMLNNLLKSGIDKKSFLILDPNQTSQIPNIDCISNYQDIASNYKADIIIFAFKPQGAEKILQNLTNYSFFDQNTIFISILAGKKIDFFTNLIGRDKKILRLMPNLPITIGEGICAYCLSSNLKDSKIKDFLNSLGKNVKVTEEMMDAATATSGSGPAYLFLIAKIMIDSASNLGLDKKTATNLVKQTILGASKMIDKEENLEQLINNVASKGGTTQAALDVFEKGNLNSIIFNAMQAAYNRSKEL